VLLHIHGFESDLFTNEFVSVIANAFQKKNQGFLTVQTRGMANEYFFKTTDGKWKKLGSHFEVLEDSYKDIDAWIELLISKGYSNIILQGHSLGTMKVLRYLFEGKHADKVTKVILLAPFDIMQLLETATQGKWREYLEIARQRVAVGKGEEVIPTQYLDVSMSYQTYVSHHQENEFEYMFKFSDKEYDFPLLQKISIPVKVIVGTKDEFFHPANPSHPEEAMTIFETKVKDFSGNLIPESGHGYVGYEQELVRDIESFIN
jgi:pimeloyl-ACP methyl ester carboxylesterase